MAKGICPQCQHKIRREIVQHQGGIVPLNKLGCEYYDGAECEWEHFVNSIIETFEKDYRIYREPTGLI